MIASLLTLNVLVTYSSPYLLQTILKTWLLLIFGGDIQARK